MDKISSQQMVPEQRLVLEALARAAAIPNLKFLELGSWAGDSTVVLGNVAKEYGGKLYCIDWWKGNEGTPLVDIAAQEDVSSFFWKRITEAGLEDTVIPIRTSTDQGVELVRSLEFDLIFIDADHRFDAISRDIENYAPLVKKGSGILCGHDCEGFLSDFDLAFLKRGKDRDCYQSVHCGVVLAVGQAFSKVAIDYSVWSVRRLEKEGPGWTPTDISVPGLRKAAYLPPPPFAHSTNYNIFRLGRDLFAVPKNLGHYDLTSNDAFPQEVLQATSLKALKETINESLHPQGREPVLIETYKSFNLISHNNEIIAVHHSLGPMDLTKLTPEEIKEHRISERMVSGNFAEEVRVQIDHLTPLLVEESYRGFNIVLYKGRFHAVAQSLGDITDWPAHDFSKERVRGRYFVLDSLLEARSIIDTANDQISENRTLNQ
ncbi:hypothetical protein NITGR_170030 [Nitrospina gracilis 3/211]|uniref:Class I SAM-dependent methyltransferase n=1 Tax=Nitrospina gracilis (strain 3/211) TaxID=1266370 RepID=M1YWB6_NITG3|nr:MULTISPECIES: class I SAM-dependent methyltransferase [Nitrospina]MCF8722817.1 hypothetical protein [Nitrospina sp. Nb-3]CCQ89773.1 hypothetical protein NITGR_170030 [Nitrospina gracilis 3/211]